MDIECWGRTELDSEQIGERTELNRIQLNGVSEKHLFFRNLKVSSLILAKIVRSYQECYFLIIMLQKRCAQIGLVSLLLPRGKKEWLTF